MKLNQELRRRFLCSKAKLCLLDLLGGWKIEDFNLNPEVGEVATSPDSVVAWNQHQIKIIHIRIIGGDGYPL